VFNPCVVVFSTCVPYVGICIPYVHVCTYVLVVNYVTVVLLFYLRVVLQIDMCDSKNSVLVKCGHYVHMDILCVVHSKCLTK
jgi:hypothetical protein